MKDIDFDELDRAVNSLMASTSAAGPVVTPPAAEQPVASPVTTAQPVAQTNSEPTATPVSVSVTPAEPVRATPPAIRRSGRFMDMVQKPSDIKSRPVTAPSREGISLTPRSESEPAQPIAAAPPVSQPTTQAPQGANDGNMPDPLDMLQPDSTAEVADTTTAVSDVPVSQSSAVGAPQDSPFLTDAKVDKRPLNSEAIFEPEMVSTPTTLVEPDTLSSDETATAPDENEKDEPPMTPTVPELDTQLVAIESGSQAGADASTDISGAPEPAVPLGATSIAQQYTPQPSTGDQSHAAIYDASQYPDALKHPAKSKSGWLWVLWVILLLGLGAGGALLLYYFGIIP